MVATTAGSVRIRYTTANANDAFTIIGPVRSEQLALGSTATRDRYFVQFQVKGSAKEDDMLLLEYKGDVAGNVNNTTTFLLPVTIQDTASGKVWETYLTIADFGLTVANTAIGTGFTQIGVYRCPAQTAVKIGHASAANSYAYAVFTSA